MKTCWKLYSIALFGMTFGCTLTERGPVEVPRVPPADTAGVEAPPTNVTVAVRPLVDGRPVLSKSADSDIVYSTGDPGRAVATALIESLRRKGITVTNSAPLTVSGEILEWYSEVPPGIAKNVESKAKIHVEVVGPTGRRLYRGDFNGEQDLTEAVITREDRDRSLALAMQQAVSQVLEDRDFLETLWAGAEREYRWRANRAPAEIPEISTR